MITQKLKMTFASGKNAKWAYFLREYVRLFTPRCLLGRPVESVLARAKKRPDYEYMEERAQYYCRLNPGSASAEGMPTISDLKVGKKKIYPLDTLHYARRFAPSLPLTLLPGDITWVPEVPSIVKSRPIMQSPANANSVLLNLNRVRHFIFVNDRIPFAEKSDVILFRGKVEGKPGREAFMERWFGHPKVDAGDVSRANGINPEWQTYKLTIPQQLHHKFIMAIEGNDVASNLKWIMSSNSIAVMPRPTYETWFMEGTIIPDYHYIEVKPDFSDLLEKTQYYLDNPDKAAEIIRNAHTYVAQFLDRKREDTIALMVLDRYFKAVAPGYGGSQ